MDKLLFSIYTDREGNINNPSRKGALEKNRYQHCFLQDEPKYEISVRVQKRLNCLSLDFKVFIFSWKNMNVQIFWYHIPMH